MRDRLANQISSFRARLACLDKPAHRAIWLDQPPVKFTQKVAEARAQFAELAQMAGKQSEDRTGIAAEKADARAKLIREAHALGGIVTVYAIDHRDESLAAKYDQALYQWQGMRDAALIGRVRLLEKDIAKLIADLDAPEAPDYALTPESLATLEAKADAFDQRVAAPRAAIAQRVQLTAALPGKSRAVKAKFAEVEALIAPFGVTPAGQAFIAAYHASRQIIDRGRGWEKKEATDPRSTD